MTKASDNIYPKVLLSLNTSSPAAPSDSSWKMYAKADGIYARSSNTERGPFSNGTASTFHGAKGSRSTTQTIGTASETAITFPTEDYDTDAYHSASGSSFTIPSGLAGYYSLAGYAQFANSTAGTFRLVRLYVNSTVVAEAQMSFEKNVGVSACVATHMSLSVSDVVDLRVYQDTGGNLNITAGSLAVALLGT